MQLRDDGGSSSTGYCGGCSGDSCRGAAIIFSVLKVAGGAAVIFSGFDMIVQLRGGSSSIGEGAWMEYCAVWAAALEDVDRF